MLAGLHHRQRAAWSLLASSDKIGSPQSSNPDEPLASIICSTQDCPHSCKSASLAILIVPMRLRLPTHHISVASDFLVTLSSLLMKRRLAVLSYLQGKLADLSTTRNPSVSQATAITSPSCPPERDACHTVVSAPVV